jgi:hypothetical protein
MFNPGPHDRSNLVSLLGFLVQGLAKCSLLVNAAIKSSHFHLIYIPRGCVAGISPDEVISVLRIKHLRKHLAVVNIGWDNGLFADEAKGGINADASFESVMADAAFIDPTSIKVFLSHALWLACPFFWNLTTIDGFVVRP